MDGREYITKAMGPRYDDTKRFKTRLDVKYS